MDRTMPGIIALQESGSILLSNPALHGVVLNIVFFMPLGFLLSYLFGWGIATRAAGMTLEVITPARTPCNRQKKPGPGAN
jgi:hypothetical protein